MSAAATPVSEQALQELHTWSKALILAAVVAA